MRLRALTEKLVVETFSVVLGILLANSWHDSSAPEGLLAIKGWNGISPPRVVDNAWQTASVTGALQYMPVATVLSPRVYSFNSA